MKVAVVGLDAIGSRRAEDVRAEGHQVITIGPGETADAADIADLDDPAAVDAWIVATPTPTRLGLVRRLLRLDPAARVLLEKPACSPQDIPVLARFLAVHPAARVLVDDVYAHSPAVRRFAGLVRAAAHSGADPLTRVTVEFTKNRERDIARGRYVDTQYGVVGYEWFHMLTILRSILPRAGYEAYLRTVPSLVTPELRVLVSGQPRLPEIELYASTQGRVGFPEAAGHAFTHPLARRRIARGHIPYGSELRYRFAEAEFASGTRVTLVFEPHYQTALDYKNVHAVHVRTVTGHRTHLVAGNQLRESLTAQLTALTRPDGGPEETEIRVLEHLHLAVLAGYAQADRGAHHFLPADSARRSFVG